MLLLSHDRPEGQLPISLNISQVYELVKGDSKTVGRVGLKAMGWFITASLRSLTLGLIMVSILRPGDNIGLPLPDVNATSSLKTASFNVKEFVAHLEDPGDRVRSPGGPSSLTTHRDPIPSGFEFYWPVVRQLLLGFAYRFFVHVRQMTNEKRSRKH